MIALSVTALRLGLPCCSGLRRLAMPAMQAVQPPPIGRCQGALSAVASASPIVNPDRGAGRGDGMEQSARRRRPPIIALRWRWWSLKRYAEAAARLDALGRARGHGRRLRAAAVRPGRQCLDAGGRWRPRRSQSFSAALALSANDADLYADLARAQAMLHRLAAKWIPISMPRWQLAAAARRSSGAARQRAQAQGL